MKCRFECNKYMYKDNTMQYMCLFLQKLFEPGAKKKRKIEFNRCGSIFSRMIDYARNFLRIRSLVSIEILLSLLRIIELDRLGRLPQRRRLVSERNGKSGGAQQIRLFNLLTFKFGLGCMKDFRNIVYACMFSYTGYKCTFVAILFFPVLSFAILFPLYS